MDKKRNTKLKDLAHFIISDTATLYKYAKTVKMERYLETRLIRLDTKITFKFVKAHISTITRYDLVCALNDLGVINVYVGSYYHGFITTILKLQDEKNI